MKFRGNSRYLRRAENVGDAKHDIICPSPLDESSQLILDILWLLSREPRDRIISAITLARRPMAILAISDLGLNVVPRNRVFCASCRRKNGYQNCQLESQLKASGFYNSTSPWLD
jgi:hypothetical protein